MIALVKPVTVTPDVSNELELLVASKGSANLLCTLYL